MRAIKRHRVCNFDWVVFEVVLEFALKFVRCDCLYGFKSWIVENVIDCVLRYV